MQQRLYYKLSELPNEQQIEQLEALIVPHEKSRKTILENWRNSPTRLSSIALVSALERLQKIRSLELKKLDISKIPLIRIKALSKTAFTIRVQAIVRMTKERRIATLVAFVYVLETIVLDDSLDLLELLLKDLLSKSKREGKKERLRTLKDLDTAALKLSQVGKILLNNDFEDSQVRAQVWEFITPEQLAGAVIQVETLARPQTR